MAASIALQVACLHSPEDLIVAARRRPRPDVRRLAEVAAPGPLGHHAARRPRTSRPRSTGPVACSPSCSRSPSSAPPARAGTRTAAGPGCSSSSTASIDPDAVARLPAARAVPRAAGISVMWICTSESRVPRQADAVLDCHRGRGQATLWSTDPEIAPQEVELGRVHADVADRVARSLAPVRDASVANATTAIPRSAPLLSVLGEEHPDAAWVVTPLAHEPALRPRAPGGPLRRRRLLPRPGGRRAARAHRRHVGRRARASCCSRWWRRSSPCIRRPA